MKGDKRKVEDGSWNSNFGEDGCGQNDNGAQVGFTYNILIFPRFNGWIMTVLLSIVFGKAVEDKGRVYIWNTSKTFFQLQ